MSSRPTLTTSVQIVTLIAVVAVGFVIHRTMAHQEMLVRRAVEATERAMQQAADAEKVDAFVTTWTSKGGVEQKVITGPSPDYANDDEWAEAHASRVAALQKLFPPVT